VEVVRVGDLAAGLDWSQAVTGCDAVVHLAARVHMMRDTAVDALAEYRRVNVEGTVALAKQSAAAGVQRFVFLSSIKVNGEGTATGRPYSSSDSPAPKDPYGLSKLEAEQELQKIADATGMEVVRVRPPLVYGPNVGANFRSMMNWVRRGIPLPFGAIDNRRSFVAVGNLVDLLVTCLEHPGARNQLFLASDGQDLSTAELLRAIARQMGKPSRLISVPPKALKALALLVGRPGIAQRLCESLQVDSLATQTTLGWRPPLSVDEALRLTVEDFLARRAGTSSE
jgi:nucleoside-diphosphate-sugar epimerase